MFVEGVCCRFVMLWRDKWWLVALVWCIDVQMVVDVSVKDVCGTASSVVKQVLSCA